MTSDGPALPQASVPARFDPSNAERVRSGLQPACGLPVNVLRCLSWAEHPAENRAEQLHLLELRADAPLPDGLDWFALSDLRADSLPPDLRAGLSAWLAESHAPPPVVAPAAAPAVAPAAAPAIARLLPDWARPGWYAQVEGWINAEMARLGRRRGIERRVLAVEPLKSWSISVVLRAQTDAGPVYFKASRALPLFVNEGVVMAALARIYPGSVPAPLAVEPARGWMLLEDFGGPLGRQATIDQQAQMYRAMANLQVDSAARIDELLRAGCIDRRIPWLLARLDGLLADEIVMGGLDASEREALVRALPRLQAMLNELDALPIPPALIHGDLHTGNSALRDGEVIFFDWTDAAISHPFFDLFDIFSVEDPVERETLKAAYRAPWEQACPAGSVGRALALARVVFGLYHAVSYQSILHNIDPADREELNTAPFFLRLVLSGLDGSV